MRQQHLRLTRTPPLPPGVLSQSRTEVLAPARGGSLPRPTQIGTPGDVRRREAVGCTTWPNSRRSTEPRRVSRPGNSRVGGHRCAAAVAAAAVATRAAPLTQLRWLAPQARWIPRTMVCTDWLETVTLLTAPTPLTAKRICTSDLQESGTSIARSLLNRTRVKR